MSLTHGWIPLVAPLIALTTLAFAVGWRSRRWRLVALPVALLAGVALAALTHRYVLFEGLADQAPPMSVWVWIALSGLAVGVLVLGWRGSRWWRRGSSALAVPLCLLCAALTLNTWVGYLPTVRSAWDRMTGTAPHAVTDRAALARLRQDGARPGRTTLVSVRIPDAASGFAHRDELVYLPPAWYATTPPPLPVVMMIGGEFGHPADWWDSGGAGRTINDFAATHGGHAPVLVFVDYSGAFSNDTECVNGTRGNAADHLTKDVIPYMVSTFGVSSNPANWGIVGWSSGGTCALTLAVMHPELFRAFVDIDGQPGPNAGTKQQTIARLFGGDPQAWAAFDPSTVITKHALYLGMSGWFAVSAPTATVYRPGRGGGAAQPTVAQNANSEDLAATANALCQLGDNQGIECSVVPEPGRHDFSSAATAFAHALPWLASKLKTPGVPKVSMPGSVAAP